MNYKSNYGNQIVRSNEANKSGGNPSQFTLRTPLLFWLSLIFLAFAYLSNLGLIPIRAMEDECRRALVPLEMQLSGNYLVPTINGELYLNKPPLFSWIVSASYEIFGSYSAFALRFPVVLSMLLFAIIIYFTVSKYTSKIVGAMTALAYLTNGRSITLDSMLGLLEHPLAMMIYSGWMLTFILGEKKKYWLLFIVTYAIAALGFLMKGLPAVAHHGLGLIIYFIFSKKAGKLISLQHAAGIIVFFLVLATYYVPFMDQTGLSLQELFAKVFDESSKRFYFRGIMDFFSILIDFPLDFIKHFLPWTVMMVLLFRKDLIAIIKENRFVHFVALLFVVNTPIYWIAALKNPHYLYMLLPLLFCLFFYIYFHKSDKKDWRKLVVDAAFGLIILACALGSFAIPFVELKVEVERIWLKTIRYFIIFISLLAVYWSKVSWRMFILVGALIVARGVFNRVVMPQRVASQQVWVDHAMKVDSIVKDEPLFIGASYPSGYYDGISFYLSRERGEILRLKDTLDDSSFFLVDDARVDTVRMRVFYKFPYEFVDRHERVDGNLYLVRVDD